MNNKEERQAIADKLEAIAVECRPTQPAIACVLYALCGSIHMLQDEQLCLFLEPFSRASMATAQEMKHRNN